MGYYQNHGTLNPEFVNRINALSVIQLTEEFEEREKKVELREKVRKIKKKESDFAKESYILSILNARILENSEREKKE